MEEAELMLRIRETFVLSIAPQSLIAEPSVVSPSASRALCILEEGTTGLSSEACKM